MMMETESDLFPYVLKLATNQALLNKTKKLMRDIAAKWSSDVFFDKLIEEMGLLVNEFVSQRKLLK